jgi:hypothetical protein
MRMGRVECLRCGGLRLSRGLLCMYHIQHLPPVEVPRLTYGFALRTGSTCREGCSDNRKRNQTPAFDGVSGWEALKLKSQVTCDFKFRRTELNTLVLERPSGDRRIPNHTRRPARHRQPVKVPCPAQRGKFSQTHQEERRVEEGRRT